MLTIHCIKCSQNTNIILYYTPPNIHTHIYTHDPASSTLYVNGLLSHRAYGYTSSCTSLITHSGFAHRRTAVIFYLLTAHPSHSPAQFLQKHQFVDMYPQSRNREILWTSRCLFSSSRIINTQELF